VFVCLIACIAVASATFGGSGGGWSSGGSSKGMFKDIFPLRTLRIFLLMHHVDDDNSRVATVQMKIKRVSHTNLALF
jgi:hypothetical protein